MDEASKIGPPPREGVYFRAVLALLAMGAAIGGFAGLFFIEIPARNENALMFAMGAVFGWASSIVASEFGSSTTAKKVTEVAVDQIRRDSK